MKVRPKKSLGQHFLKDESIARRIVDYLNPEIPFVLEIGPGKGILSKYLLEDSGFDPWFIEIDRESVAYLKEHYPAIRDRIIEADFLKLDLRKYPTPSPTPEREGSKSPCELKPLAKRRGSEAKGAGANRDSGIQSVIRHPSSVIQILGNFPYNISSQILFRVLEYKELVQEVTGMFQREVALRIASPPGSKQYGILSVLLQAFYRVEYLFSVSESVFIPPPKVQSAVVKLVRNEVQSLDCDERFWKTVIKTAFNQRRKTLRNSLKKLGPEGFSRWDDPMFDLRPERLQVSDFVRLARMLHPGSSEKY
jgi:16S rRNA (adenine1518-N6/adenine1519-N6)-dimethyltransferase